MSSPARLHTRTLPAAATTGRASGSTIGAEMSVVTLTADRELLATVQAAVGESMAVLHAETPDAAVDLLLAGHCGVMLADLGTLATDFTDLLRHLQEQFPDLVIVAAGGRADERRISTLLSEGSLYRFLHKPASPARARLFIEASVRRHREVQGKLGGPIGVHLRRWIRRDQRRLLLAAAAVLALAVVGYVATRSDDPAPSSAPATPPAASASADAGAQQPTNRELAEILERARRALLERRYLEPVNDNALHHYRAALALEPNEPEAVDGLHRVAEILLTEAEHALIQDDPAGARRLLEAVRTADPDHPRLAFLEAQITSEARKAARAAESPQKTVAAAAPAAATPAATTPVKKPVVAPPAAGSGKARELLALAGTRMDMGQLHTPQGDSALDYLREARSIAPASNEIAGVAAALGSALIASADDAVRSGDLNAGQERLEAARTVTQDFAVPLAQWPEAMTRLDAALQASAAAALAENRLGEAAVILAQLNKVSPGSQQLAVLDEELEKRQRRADFLQVAAPVSELERTREVAPTYPREAARKGIEGWVDVEFVVGADGVPADLIVRSAEPAGVFDAAAIDALKRWRFKPRIDAGEPVAQRLEVRLRFNLEK